jgi:hypothetical protein
MDLSLARIKLVNMHGTSSRLRMATTSKSADDSDQTRVSSQQ